MKGQEGGVTLRVRFREREGSALATLGDTHYCSEIRTRCLCSFGRWPTPVELHTRFEVRQLEHGDSLSHRTCAESTN